MVSHREIASAGDGALNRAPWSNVYGTARTLLALSTLATLAAHDVDVLFRPLGVEVGTAADGQWILKLSLFSLMGGDALRWARWLAIGVLALVASGWRPRITGILHWWIAFSFAVSCVAIDGGDQVAAVLTLLLLPMTLTDRRRWHWSPPAGEARGGGAGTARAPGLAYELRALTARSALVMIRLQVAVIYLVAAAAKLGVPEWRNGTALYYWLAHPVFGLDGWRLRVVLPALANPAMITLSTWGVLALEFLLFAGLVMEPRRRPALLAAGIVFHSGIALVHGLFSFALNMIAALVLYLRPPERVFSLPARLARQLGAAASAPGRWIGELSAATGGLRSSIFKEERR